MILRAVLVLLLVLNAGVGLWWMLGGSDVPPPSQPVSPGVPGLQLVTERQDAPPPASMPAAPAAAEPAPASDDLAGKEGAPVLALGIPPGARCFAFGPFKDRDGALAMRKQVLASVAGARVREDAAKGGPTRWTVMMPRQPDRDAANATAQRLAAAGFKDHYVIGSGEFANAIALGRFSSEEAAQRHVQALRSAGFQAEIAPAAALRYWLEVVAGQDFDPTATRKAGGAERMRELGCARLG